MIANRATRTRPIALVAIVAIVSFGLAAPGEARADDALRRAVDRGRDAVESGRAAQRAADALEQAIEAHLAERDDVAAGLLLLGELHERAGRAEEALAAYARLRTLFPEMSDAAREADRRAESLRGGRGSFLDAITAKAENALGAERRRKLETMRVTGTLVVTTPAAEVEFVLEVAADGRFRHSSPGRSAGTGFDGERGWRLSKDGVGALEGPALDRMVEWAEATWREARGDDEAGTRVRLRGPSRAQGRRAWAVEYESLSSRRTVHYDADSGLPLLAEGRFPGLDGGTIDRIYYYDYVVVEGARFAGRAVHYAGDEIAYEFRYEKTELDPKLGDDAFAAPEGPPAGGGGGSGSGDRGDPGRDPGDGGERRDRAPVDPDADAERGAALRRAVERLLGDDEAEAERAAVELYRRPNEAAVPPLIAVLEREEAASPRRPLHGLVLQALQAATGWKHKRAADWREAWAKRSD